MSLFGHADPAGNDNYNKILSGSSRSSSRRVAGPHDRREVPELRRGERVCGAAPEGEALVRGRLSEPLTASRW
jgi:hypothetical protein